jgi:two-component system, NtrC family, sensor histidine kinase HydH
MGTVHAFRTWHEETGKIVNCSGGGLLIPIFAGMRSLRTKLLLFSLLLIVVPGAVLGVALISSSRTALTEAVGRQLAEAAHTAADSLARTVARERAELGTFARQDLMREIRIGDLDKRIAAFLLNLKNAKDSLLELRVSNLEGRVIAATAPGRQGASEPSASAAGDRRPALGGPLILPDGTQALEISVAIPDPDSPETPLGRLTALYEWHRLTADLDQMSESLHDMGLDVDLLVSDDSGVVIGGALRANTKTPLGSDLRALRFALEEELREPTAVGFVVDHGARALVGYRRLPGGDPPWTLLVAQPLSKALAPVRSMTRNLAFVIAAVLAVALTLATPLADRVARPLRQLTDAAKNLASGETAVPVVSTTSRDEVGELAAAFNQMAIDLRRAQSEVLEAAKFAFVGELAAGVAHEVRTALGVLRSSVQLLAPVRDSSDPEARELIQIMHDELDHLGVVVDQLLNLGRPRELAIEPTRLAAVVSRAADFVDPQARTKDVTIRRAIDADDPRALCDEEQIYQVALNLLVNAVQLSPRGSEVVLGWLPRRERRVGFEVRDEGPGIAEDLREKIFQPFFTRREGGIGLGLTLVQRVVRDHGGRLSVQSEVGKGSVFRVELPAAERDS